MSTEVQYGPAVEVQTLAPGQQFRIVSWAKPGTITTGRFEFSSPTCATVTVKYPGKLYEERVTWSNATMVEPEVTP